MRALAATVLTSAIVVGCGSSGGEGAPPADAAAPFEAGDWMTDGGLPLDASWPAADGGFSAGEAGVIRADRFVTKVVSFTPGPCAGFGKDAMPGVVEGPPIGGGDSQGSTDVVSLGVGGEIVVSFEPNAIVDGPGVDLLVFENAFYAGGNSVAPYAEPGEVSVSDDGVTWTTFPCTATKYPYGACAGWHPVYANPSNGISPIDPSAAGGDPFDLADIGVKHARYVRVRDKSNETCAGAATSDGFDLDAMAIVNAELN